MTLNLTASYAVVLSIAVNTTTSVIVQAAVVPITTVLSYTSVVPYAAVTISTSSVNTASAFRTSRYAGRTAVAAMEFTTIPTVVHAYMLSSWGTEVISATVVVAAIAVDMPRMSATIGDIEVRTSEVEVVAMRIAGIDAEVPVAGLPVEGAIEIGGCQEGVPLPVEKNITQVKVTTLPVNTEYIVATSHTHQIVEIDLIASLVLLVGEVELIGHLIGQEQSLVTGLLETHGGGRDCDCQHRHQGHQHLFHNRIF